VIEVLLARDLSGDGHCRRSWIYQETDTVADLGSMFPSNVEVSARVTESCEVLGGFVLRAAAVFLERRNCKKA
jgi:hypothetical protein